MTEPVQGCHQARVVHRRDLSTDFETWFRRTGPAATVAGVQSSLGYLIRSNGGFFSRAEALDCGETDRTLANACRMGTIVRLRRGMYAPADVYRACDDAASISCTPAPRLAAQRGPVAWRDDQRPVMDLPFTRRIVPWSISFALIGASRRAARAKHHVVSQDIEGDLDVYDGIVAVSPARAVWEVACRSSLEGGVVTADSALHHDPRLREPIEELQLRFAHFPYQGKLAIKLADGHVLNLLGNQ